MKSSANNFVKALATGVAVLVLFVTAMFWLRSSVERRVISGWGDDVGQVAISPSGLLPDDVERAPDVVNPSLALSVLDRGKMLGFHGLGLPEYLAPMRSADSWPNVLYYGGSGSFWSYFDRSSGKIVTRQRDQQTQRVVTFYAGPDGITDSPGDEVGRFVDPFGVRIVSSLVIYDRGLRRFFSIDCGSYQVNGGPEMPREPEFQPVRIVDLDSNDGILRLSWDPPMKLAPEEDRGDGTIRGGRREYTVLYRLAQAQSLVPVVNASGRIDLLDIQTLDLAEGKGRLPEPLTYYGFGSSRTSQLCDYDVMAICAGEDLQYIGMVAASLSREGTAVALATYDERGIRVGRADSGLYGDYQISREIREGSARQIFWGMPWGPAMAISKYFVETIHPPVLTLASFWAVDHIDARAGQRSLFLLPNSFAAMHRVEDANGPGWQFAGAVWCMVPAFVLAGFLAWRVARDMAFLGRSQAGRRAWILATVLFSVPAHITYRLTRPKEPLVTCANCGQPRRPDMERCHRCRSPWDVPELVPPAWRVLDDASVAREDAESSEKDATPPEQNPDSSVESM